MIYDGSLHDSTNFASSKYIEINSCNIQQSRKKAHTVVRAAGRVDYHILYVAEGECLCLYGDEEKMMKKGEFVLYPPNETQRYSFMEGTAVTTMWVHFAGTGIEEILSELGLSCGIHRAPLQGETEHYFRRMINTRVIDTPKHRVAARGYLLNLLSSLSQKDAEVATYSGAVLRMIEYINLNWQKRLTVAELAEKVNLSESRAAHLFREAVGKSIHSYISGIKISTAKELLSSTELTISEISSMVGFDDPLYFSRAFRSAVGIPPSEFRG